MATKIKKILDEKGVRYSFVAEKTGISREMLSNYLNGKAKFSLKAVKAIMELYPEWFEIDDFISEE